MGERGHRNAVEEGVGEFLVARPPQDTCSGPIGPEMFRTVFIGWWVAGCVGSECVCILWTMTMN